MLRIIRLLLGLGNRRGRNKHGWGGSDDDRLHAAQPGFLAILRPPWGGVFVLIGEGLLLCAAIYLDRVI